MKATPPLVLCLSHLRWNFVYQRPQHLLSRCARERPVVFFEEPHFDGTSPRLAITEVNPGLMVATPHLPDGTSIEAAETEQRVLLDELLRELDAPPPIMWFYTPMALGFAGHIDARATVYDCMDELSLFHNAPPNLIDRERVLIRRADVMFTGGHSLYEHKRSLHRNIHAFPSSVDVEHFACARQELPEPPDQAGIPRPRIGYAGVIDERMDLALIDAVAAREPGMHLVFVGPVVKIDPATLPRRPNIHWLGPKRYEELPGYLSGWDAGMLPFARNDATRFISPTKTPEYLAAGKPVVSTSIRDVVRPYGQQRLAWIADDALAFGTALREALASDAPSRLARADAFLADLSWDRTWGEMWAHVETVTRSPAARRVADGRALAQEG